MKNYKIAAAVLAIAIAAVSVAKAGNIDIGFDVTRSADVSSLKEMVARSETGFEMNKVRLEGYTPEVACSTLELDSRDGNYIKRNIHMESVLYSKTCDHNGCFMESTAEHAYAELTINTRQLSDSETEQIEVCHNFVNKKGSYRIISSPFVYAARVKQPTSSSMYSLELTPLPKTTMAAAASVFGPQRKVAFNQYNPSWDDNGYGFVPCSEAKMTWESTDVDWKIMDRDGHDIYVCDVDVTWSNHWKGCTETNPHTYPGYCSCKIVSSKSTHVTDRCAWQAEE